MPKDKRGGAKTGGSLFNYKMPKKAIIGDKDAGFTVSVNSLRDNGIDERMIKLFGKYTDPMQNKINALGIDVDINIPKYTAASQRQLDYANKLAEQAVYAAVSKAYGNVKKAQNTDSLKKFAESHGIKPTAQSYAEYYLKNASIMKAVLESKNAGDVIDKLKNNQMIMNLSNNWKRNMGNIATSSL